LATWITHLRLAEILLKKIDGLDPSLFAIGNIAPDSGIPDENWEKFTPDPKVTHFRVERDGGAYSLADAAFYRAYLAPLRTSWDPARFSLRLGYWFHLIADNLWALEIGRPTQARFPAEFSADPKFILTVKEDWYGLDFVYVRGNPNCLFWTIFLKGGCADTGLDFLPLIALQQRIAYIQTYYQSHGDEIEAMVNRPFIYLSQSQMDRFVAVTADVLYRAYQVLWLDGKDIPAAVSALEILPYHQVYI
jgi:hypothetical protein